MDDIHSNLISTLVSVLQRRGFDILHVANFQNYSQPYRIGRHEPDIIARSPEGLIVIGEAKTAEDISSERSKEQYIDFATRQMAEGALKGQSVPLHIIVYNRSDLDTLKRTLYDLSLTNRIGQNIFFWYLNE